MGKAGPTTGRTFARIRRYVRGEGLSMAFQPIADLGSGHVVGFESLARFDGRPPDTCFDEAAAAGLRRELEMAAARAAIGSLDALPAGAFLTINASPDVAMSSLFLKAVSSGGSRIVVEITEHAPIEDYEALGAALEALRAHGVRVAIDDAGAGFANMNHMLRIDADLIKLDTEITRHIDIDARRKAMVASLVDFARSVGATLVAEGIETESELEALRRLGVHEGQGYHLGRPAPLPSELGAQRPSPKPGGLRSATNRLADAATFVFGRGRPRRRRLAPALLVLVGALLLGPATIAVAENSTPGSPGYWLKRRVEDVRLLAALDRDSETQLHMQFARRRISELHRLLANGRSGATDMVLEDFQRHVAYFERSLPGGGASASWENWVGAELADYVDALEREGVDGCGKDRGPACGSIERAVKSSRAALERVEVGPGKAPAPNEKPAKPAGAPAKPATEKGKPATATDGAKPAQNGPKAPPGNPKKP